VREESREESRQSDGMARHEATDCQISEDPHGRLSGFRMNNGIAVMARRESGASTGVA